MKKISVVTPIYNEAGNLVRLHGELSEVLRKIGVEYEVIAVNDGSTDGSLKVMSELARTDPRFKVLDFRMNRGQTAALMAGLDHATGDMIITIDSDLENDPADIPLLVAKLDEGYEVVSGWRKNRWKGKWLSRKLPSICANWMISRITGVRLHDYGCILKAYRLEVISGVSLYGEMHRFIPAYASWKGARVAEIIVSHRPRSYGRSNYGLSRMFKVVLDLIVIRFLDRYMDKPIHFFGGLGFISLALGFLAGLAAVVLKIMHLRDFVSTPLPVFSALLIIVGVQLAAMGIIAEILMRTYYGSQNKKPYDIKQMINL
jgi:glycosyltransferase involved in cell wall biosynthesis